MASRADTTLKPDAGLTSEQLRDVRARAWSYVFACYAKKKAAPVSGPDDGTKVKEDSANVSSLSD